jgi:hypothetical protein
MNIHLVESLLRRNDLTLQIWRDISRCNIWGIRVRVIEHPLVPVELLESITLEVIIDPIKHSEVIYHLTKSKKLPKKYKDLISAMDFLISDIK